MSRIFADVITTHHHLASLHGGGQSSGEMGGAFRRDYLEEMSQRITFTDSTDIKRIRRGCYGQHHPNRFDNLEQKNSLKETKYQSSSKQKQIT